MIVEELYSIVKKLIKSTNDKKSNELRFKIGEAISSTYVKYKEDIKNKSVELEEEIIEFYKAENISSGNISSGKFNKLSSWDKVKAAISDALSKKYIDDGYSVTNLGYMQQFYRKYRNAPENLKIAFQLDWSHNVELLKDKLNDDERRFYLKKALLEKWSLNELEKQIKEEKYDEFLKVIEECKYRYKIEKVEISNYKSLVKVELINPSPLLVFAGANATGKSSIFEAIEFLMHSAMTFGDIAFDIFGGIEKIVNYNLQKGKSNDAEMLIKLTLAFENQKSKQQIEFAVSYDYNGRQFEKMFTNLPALDSKIVDSFSRLYIDNNKRAENKLKRYNKLWLDASNLNRILKNILDDNKKKEEIIEWLKILVPEVENIQIEQDISGKEELRIFEKAHPSKPFTGNLISEGTYNIIALLTMFYQSDNPQFICIEEPETGLNPAILKELVPFFREMSSKNGHHIWVTTHSTSLVAELIEEELIIVNKKDGETSIYPCKEGDFEEMKPDNAWMSNMLKGGGLPW